MHMETFQLGVPFRLQENKATASVKVLIHGYKSLGPIQYKNIISPV